MVSALMHGHPPEVHCGPHLLEGMGCGYVPGLLDVACVDEIHTVSDREAVDMADRLGRLEGILVSTGGGGVVAVARKLAQMPHLVLYWLCDRPLPHP